MISVALKKQICLLVPDDDKCDSTNKRKVIKKVSVFIG